MPTMHKRNLKLISMHVRHARTTQDLHLMTLRYIPSILLENAYTAISKKGGFQKHKTRSSSHDVIIYSLHSIRKCIYSYFKKGCTWENAYAAEKVVHETLNSEQGMMGNCIYTYVIYVYHLLRVEKCNTGDLPHFHAKSLIICIKSTRPW